MNVRSLLLLLAGSISVGAQRLPDDFDPERAEREGRELTAQLLSQSPNSNHTNTGTLEIKRRGSDAVKIPIRFTVLVSDHRWISLYESLNEGTNTSLSTLTILHQPNRPSRYFRNRPADLEHATPLTADQVGTLRFAGSDFWVGDLGLEFLRWPVQRLLMKDIRRGQSCNVLESINTNAHAGGYSRVVSWLDIDTGGIVLAEAYDAQQKRIKEFIPKSFKKIEGEWQLKEMRIEDATSKSKTTIFFDVGKE